MVLAPRWDWQLPAGRRIMRESSGFCLEGQVWTLRESLVRLDPDWASVGMPQVHAHMNSTLGNTLQIETDRPRILKSRKLMCRIAQLSFRGCVFRARGSQRPAVFMRTHEFSLAGAQRYPRWFTSKRAPVRIDAASFLPGTEQTTRVRACARRGLFAASVVSRMKSPMTWAAPSAHFQRHVRTRKKSEA